MYPINGPKSLQVKSTLAVAYMQSTLSGEYKCGINYGGAIIYSTATTINVAGKFNQILEKGLTY